MAKTLFFLLKLGIEANPETKQPYLQGSWLKGYSKDGITIDREIGRMVQELDPALAPFVAQQFGQALPYDQLAHVVAENPPPSEETSQEKEVGDEPQAEEAPKIVKEITVPASTLKSMKPASKAKR